MIRRAILVAAAAVALSLAPSVATAYAPAGFSPPMADPTPADSVPFAVHATGANANEVVTLTITPDPASIGTTSLAQKANAQGVVDFTVTLTEDGTYLLVSTGASGAVLDTQTVTVVQHGAVIVAGTSAGATADTSAGATADTSASADTRTSATAGSGAGATADSSASATAGTGASATAGTSGSGGQLSFTGFRGMGLALGGGVLVLAGSGLILLGQRRQSAPPLSAPGRRG